MKLDNRFLYHGTDVLRLHLKKGLCGITHLDMLFLTKNKIKDIVLA